MQAICLPLKATPAIALALGRLPPLGVLKLRAVVGAVAETAADGAAAGACEACVGVLEPGEEGRDAATRRGKRTGSAQEEARVGLEWDAPLLGLLEEVLEVEQRLLARVHVDKGRGNTRLATSAGTANLMDVVFDLLRH